jgi:hypothetical protein
MPLYPQNVVSQEAYPNSLSFRCSYFWIRSWVYQGVWGVLEEPIIVTTKATIQPGKPPRLINCCCTTTEVGYVATLALGSRPRQRGCKGVGQEKARESHHILPGM